MRGQSQDESQVSGLGDSVEDGMTKLSWHMLGGKGAWSGGNYFTLGYAELEVWNISGSDIQEEFGLKLKRKLWAENIDVYD